MTLEPEEPPAIEQACRYPERQRRQPDCLMYHCFLFYHEDFQPLSNTLFGLTKMLLLNLKFIVFMLLHRYLQTARLLINIFCFYKR